MIEIIKDNTYLIKQVSSATYQTILEWECISVSEKAYKFRDKINERIFWIDKSQIKERTLGSNGYFVFECIFDKREEFNKTIKHFSK